jgi:hypothetical protein
VKIFADIFIEVDRAIDNLVKSGKLFTGAPSRRDSLPMMMNQRPFSEYGERFSILSPKIF